MGSRVYASCSSSEHLLKEKVGLVWFVAGYNFGRLHIDLLANHQFN